jgi:biopolymer transport protein ExbD
MHSRRDNMVEEAAFDLTPMIDVVMLLIVFFMMTAQFAASMRSSIDLPREAGANLVEARHSIEIELTRQGEYRIEGDVVSSDRLLQLVGADLRRSKKEELEIVVRADRNTSASHLNALARELGKLGIRSWKLSTAGGEGA